MELQRNSMDSVNTNGGDEDLIRLVELADSFSKLYEEEKRKLPFHINTIDEIHADENAHTRILLRFLEYKSGGEYIFLKSFIGLMSSDLKPFIHIINKPRITFNEQFNGRYIDGLIEEKGEYAIIIENKIHGATDQNKQIEDYVNNINELSKTPLKNIYVIYLTKDGRKIVGENSLSPEKKGKLDNRFVAMNYREGILPWLRDELLPNCKIKETWLSGAMSQYIDHLEGMFGMRGIQQDMQKKLNDYLMEQLRISNRDYGESLEQIEVIHSKINKIDESIMEARLLVRENIWNEVFISDLEQIAKDLNVDVKYSTARDSCNRYKGFEFTPNNWTNSAIRFEFQTKAYRDLVAGIHRGEKGTIVSDEAQIYEALTQKIGKGNPSNEYWIYSKYLGKNIFNEGNRMFHQIFVGELKEPIKELVQKYIKACDGFDM